MSEEEKKAIEIIKKEITKPETTPLEVYVTDIKMLLHIIDKQQKEIEELNAENAQLINQITDGYWENDRLKEETERLNQEIRKWAEKEHNLTQALLSKRTNFISKDKIREILQIEGNADIETYLKTIVAENNRLENIEDDRDCNYISKEKIREVIGTPYPEIAIDNLLKLLEE